MWLCWAGSCQHNDSSPTLWITTNLENFLPRPHALHSGPGGKKDTHVRGEFQTSENGWWARRRRRGKTGTKKTQPPDTFFFCPRCTLMFSRNSFVMTVLSGLRFQPLQGHDVISLAPPVMSRTCHQLPETEMGQHRAECMECDKIWGVGWSGWKRPEIVMGQHDLELQTLKLKFKVSWTELRQLIN